MTVEELMLILNGKPHDARVVDESGVNTINNVSVFVASDGEVRVCIQHS